MLVWWQSNPVYSVFIQNFVLYFKSLKFAEKLSRKVKQANKKLHTSLITVFAFAKMCKRMHMVNNTQVD